MNMKSISLAILTLLSLSGENVMAVEEAVYSVSRQQDSFEIREYEPAIVAEVIVSGDFEKASSAAFRTLFKYISGNNTSRSKIAMTAPVTQKPPSEKIAMTSPVGQRKAAQGWAVSFMMPASYTMNTIPLPSDPAVVLRKIPAYRAAAIRYSGGWSEKRYLKHLSLLREWMQSENLVATGEPIWARYNAPITPWFLRRNEILIPIGP